MNNTISIHSTKDRLILRALHKTLSLEGLKPDMRDVALSSAFDHWLVVYADGEMRFRWANYEPWASDSVRFIDQSNYASILQEIRDAHSLSTNCDLNTGQDSM